MSQPNLDNVDIRNAYDSARADQLGADVVLRALSDVLRGIRADVQELIPKMGTYVNGDPLDVVHAHLTLAIAALPDGEK